MQDGRTHFPNEMQAKDGQTCCSPACGDVLGQVPISLIGPAPHPSYSGGQRAKDHPRQLALTAFTADRHGCPCPNPMGFSQSYCKRPGESGWRGHRLFPELLTITVRGAGVMARGAGRSRCGGDGAGGRDDCAGVTLSQKLCCGRGPRAAREEPQSCPSDHCRRNDVFCPGSESEPTEDPLLLGTRPPAPTWDRALV